MPISDRDEGAEAGPDQAFSSFGLVGFSSASTTASTKAGLGEASAARIAGRTSSARSQ
jgi:hypothetical protein